MRPIPASILTGFLGAGKTTLLNYILREQSDYKFGVIVNEVGEVGIDGQLVENQQEELVQLSNGCVCCTIRKDLIKGVQKLLARGGFDYLLVETTGIADPGPVAQTFLNIPQLQQLVRLDSIITVVDAEQITAQMQADDVAREQIALADFVLVNKTDLVTPQRVAEVRGDIARLNPHARVFETSHSQADLRELLEMHAFDLDRKLALDPAFLDEFKKSSHGDIISFAFRYEQALDLDRFEAFAAQLSETQTVLRSKGIVWVAGNPRRAVFHGVNNRFTLFWDRLWEKDEERISQLVFIGKSLDRGAIEADLHRCLAT